METPRIRITIRVARRCPAGSRNGGETRTWHELAQSLAALWETGRFV